MVVRRQRSALDGRVHAGARVAGSGALDRFDWVVVLAHTALGGDICGEPVLSGARGDSCDGLCLVRRTARPDSDRRDDCLRRRGVPGKSAGLSASAYSKTKAFGRSPKASARVLEAASISAGTSWISSSFSLISCRPFWLIFLPLISCRPSWLF